jgi:Rgg/GadR/MutR family transcriptional activator
VIGTVFRFFLGSVKMLGSIFKGLRISKGMKPKEVYKGVMSRTNYWRFENGETETSFEAVFKVLRKINVDLTEFICAMPEVRTFDYEKMIYDREKFFFNQDIEALEIMATEFENLFEQSHSVKFHHAYCVTLLLIRRLNGNKPLMSQYKPLHEYLFKCEYWTNYEVLLFSSIMYTFKFSDVHILFNRARKGIHRYPDMHRSWKDEVTMLLNYLSLCIQNDDVVNISEIYQILDSLTFDEKSLYNRVLTKWAKSIIKGYLSKDLSYFKAAQNTIEIFEEFDMTGSFNMMSAWTKMYNLHTFKNK